MANNFTTSVNILRDTDRDFSYIPTPNAKQVASQLVNDFKKGLRSFNIIGTYGTGKSSFLLALEQSIKGQKRFFDVTFTNKSHVEFVKIIGSYDSIIEQFAEIFDVSTSKNKHENILSEIFNKYHVLGKENGLLFIVIDEFGKFLEYASKHNPETELYFIQQLAEFCNNPKYDIVLLTTVHQGFDSYSYTLTSTQKQEWTKVKGRFREVTFNEPVEQLLYLAAEHVNANFPNEAKPSIIKKSTKLIRSSKILQLNEAFLDEVASKLFPLDILAANVLTLSLQRYGQNERSLFSFLESTDHTSIAKYNKIENPFYNLSCVYDYLNFNFYSFLTSKYNPDFSQWSSIRSAIEEVERTFDKGIIRYVNTIKIIGLLNIFAAKGAVLDSPFLAGYLEVALGLKDASSIIDELENKKIIRFRSHSRRYILFEGTDLDIHSALIEAGNKISEVSDVTTLLNRYFHFNPVFAKLYSYERGTPRYFDFIISEYPINKKPEGEIDGFVNLLFNSTLSLEELVDVSLQQDEAVIYCYFKNSLEIKNLLFEIEKIQRVIDENKEDKVAKKELENIVEAQIRLLNHYITDSIYANTTDVIWLFQGVEQNISDKKDFNKLLSQVCNYVYSATPTFKNELVNKHKISSSIHTAKRNYFRALVQNWDTENLGFDEAKFPPEKTIYLSLLKENNISPAQTSSGFQELARNSSFNKLWNVSNDFINSAKQEQQHVSELVNILKNKPFKLKQGLIDFWVPTYLFIRRDDFAIFNDEGYIPYLSEENLELIAKYPDNYYIKSFDIEGVKLDIFNSYRTFLDQSTELSFNNISFIETIKPFITFYKQLPQYSKQTQRLSESALKIRKAISASKDPEDTFFNAFPDALGFSLDTLQRDKSKLQDYTIRLQDAVRELRTSYDALINRFEEFINIEFVGKLTDFEDYKAILQNRFSKLKKHLLLAAQRTFIQRIDSALDDRKAWLNSIAQALLGKTLEMVSDAEEIVLYEKFRNMILELDSLTNISKIDIDESNEDVISVKIDTFFNTINPKLVRMPKNKTKEMERVKDDLKKSLSADKTLNIAAMLNLLKDLLG